MRILISAQNNASGVIRGLAGDLGGFGVAALGTVAAVAAVGVALGKAVTMAGDFQAGITTLKTGAGELESNLGMVSQGILDLATKTGTSTKDLTSAMFLIESASFHGADGLKILEVAAEGAKVGVANLTQTTDILTTTLHDYNIPASQAVGVMNSLIETVKNGKMHMDDLNASLTKVLPVSAAYKVHLADVEAALAQMAAAGDRGALAGTHLAMMLKAIESPAASAQKEMAAMGIDSIKLADTMKTSLPAALMMIQNAVSQHFTPGSVEYNRAIAAILGGSKSGQAGLELFAGGLKNLQSLTNTTAAALHKGGNAVQGWGDVQKDFNFQLDRGKEALEVLGIRIGTLLLPVLTRILQYVVPIISKFGEWATSTTGLGAVMSRLGSTVQTVIGWFRSNILPTLQAIGSFLVSTFAPVWQQLVTVWNSQILPALKQLWTALQPLMPVLKMIGAIIATVVVVALVLLISVLAGVLKGLAGLLSGVATVIGGIVQIFSGGIQVIIGIVHFFIDLLTGNFKNLGNDLKAIWQGIVTMLTGVWNVIKGVFQTAIGLVVGFVSGFISTVIGIFQHLASMLVGHSIVPDMINSIVAFFASLPGRALSAVQSLMSRLAGFFSNLAGQALQWGKNVIQSVINGIQSMIGGVAQAAQNVASTIAGFLGIHSPAKMGPLSELEQWPKNLVKAYAAGLTNNTPTMSAAAGTMAGSIAGKLGGSAGGRGPITINNTFNVPQLSQSEMDKAVTYMADRLRAQMGNI